MQNTVSLKQLSPLIDLRPCNIESDGPFIRGLTKSNFYDIMQRTIGWNEARHQQEPKQPACYQMVYRQGERIGFLNLRHEQQSVYLATIQLLPEARGTGIGTLLMQYVEHVAMEGKKVSIRLRVFKDNPAKNLYDRLGYITIESNDHSNLMEKKIERSNGFL